MEFEWDDAKRRQNLARHAVNFAVAAGIFNTPVVDRVDDRKDHGELRMIALGWSDGDVYVVTYTVRDGVIRLISAWLGGRKEHEQYYKSLAERNQPDETGR